MNQMQKKEEKKTINTNSGIEYQIKSWFKLLFFSWFKLFFVQNCC